MRSLLVIGYVWPEPRSSAAGTRMMQLLNFFKSEGFDITFATTAAETEVMEDLSAHGINTEKIKLNDPEFDIFLKELDPEIVLFDRFMMEEQFGWRVSEVCPKALKILDTEDLHFFRKARQEASKKDLAVSVSLLQNDLTKREIASIYRCDLSLIISEVEMELLKTTFRIPQELLLYLPFMEEIPSGEKRSKLPTFEEREHFISIGNFRHEPNWDAVLHLKQNIWPLIRKQLPSAEIHIYGAYAGSKVTQLHNPKEGFIVKGRAASAEKVIREARVLLAPLRFGAGLKGKFIDAMKAGTPGVTTPLGAEGMSFEGAWGGLIAEKPKDFASAAVKLYKIESEWQKAQRTGFKLLEKKYSKNHFSEVFRERIYSLLRDLLRHRETNFTGNMLHHHQMASTKFMSKYIEMKNRLEKLTAKK